MRPRKEIARVIENLSEAPYRNVAIKAQRWLKAPDSPLAHVGSRWSLISRDDSWFLLASAIAARRPPTVRGSCT